MGEKLIFDYMNKDNVCSHVEVDLKTKIITCENFTNFKVHTAFGLRPLTMENLDFFFRSRCFSEQRPDKDELLGYLGLTQYSPIDIVRKTHGAFTSDNSWIRFEGETLTFKEACECRNHMEG